MVKALALIALGFALGYFYPQVKAYVLGLLKK